jgi:hypothetical protein
MVIRVDVHHAGENLIHTICTLPTLVYVCLGYAFYGQSTYVATFYKAIIALDGPYCS